MNSPENFYRKKVALPVEPAVCFEQAIVGDGVKTGEKVVAKFVLADDVRFHVSGDVKVA